MRTRQRGDRGVSSTIGVVLLVALVVTLSAAAGLFFFGTADGSSSQPVPQGQIDVHFENEPGSQDDWIRFTYAGGDSVRAETLLIVSTKKVDIDGGKSFAGGAALSKRESFVESPPGGPVQVDVGDTWDAGETAYVGGNGDLEGETFKIVWNPQRVEGQNPGSLASDSAHVLFEYTARD